MGSIYTENMTDPMFAPRINRNLIFMKLYGLFFLLSKKRALNRGLFKAYKFLLVIRKN